MRAFKSLHILLGLAASVLPAAALQAVDLAETMHHDEMLVDVQFRHLVTPKPGSLSSLATFHLNSDGTCSDWNYRRPSGDQSFDAACRMAIESVTFVRFEGKPYLTINATFAAGAKGGSVSFNSPDVPGGSSKVDRIIANTKTVHMNTIKIMKERISSGEKVLGADSGKLSESINFLANQYKEVGDYKNSEISFKRALAIREKVNGAESAETAQTITMMGEMYQAKGDKVEAENSFKKVIEMKDLKPQAKIKTLQAYAKMQMKEGKQADADAMFKQISEIMQNKASGAEESGQK